jgi:hypothetical protein
MFVAKIISSEGEFEWVASSLGRADLKNDALKKFNGDVVKIEIYLDEDSDDISFSRKKLN